MRGQRRPAEPHRGVHAFGLKGGEHQIPEHGAAKGHVEIFGPEADPVLVIDRLTVGRHERGLHAFHLMQPLGERCSVRARMRVVRIQSPQLAARERRRHFLCAIVPRDQVLKLHRPIRRRQRFPHHPHHVGARAVGLVAGHEQTAFADRKVFRAVQAEGGHL